jgi:CRP-like cAMP-binding protein
MSSAQSVRANVARLLPDAAGATVDLLERAAHVEAFDPRRVLHAKGIQLPPFILLAGHAIVRRVAETGQVRAALIAGPGYFGGLRSISDPDGDAVYELVALTDGSWATWEPRFLREVALQDAALAVGLLDHSSEFATILTMRLDERSFETALQRLATILTRYGMAIFDTPHPVANRADLAAMIGTSQVMMYRALRTLETDGLVERQRGGGIAIIDPARLSDLIRVGAPSGAPAL